MSQQTCGPGGGGTSSYQPSATITSSSQEHCLDNLKQEEFDPSSLQMCPPPGLSSLDSSCPPLSSLTASIEARDCHMDKVSINTL